MVVAPLTHPRLTTAEFIAAMWRTGWKAPMELIDGEVVVIPPSGADASLAQTQVVHRLCAWQEAEGRSGCVLTDVFVRVQDAFLAPDVAWWGAGREPRIEPGAIDTPCPISSWRCSRRGPATTTLARSAADTSPPAFANCG